MTPISDVKSANQLLKQASKMAILNAARDCYYKKGIENTSIDDIVAGAKVARATVYRNFKGKEDILAHFLYLDLDKEKNQLIQDLEQTQTVHEYIAEIFRFVAYEVPKIPLYKICFANQSAISMTLEAINTSKVTDQLMSEILEPCFQRAKKGNFLRRGMSSTMMMEWIKRLVISFLVSEHDNPQDSKTLNKYIKTFILPSIFKD
ncbi:MAG: TetR/AcrR family transcriptional regulator [Pseudomonadales bacterium]|nr:TetR/AcrR family transcriptional regulator [Pseudomonadales bacterium]